MNQTVGSGLKPMLSEWNEKWNWTEIPLNNVIAVLVTERISCFSSNIVL